MTKPRKRRPTFSGQPNVGSPFHQSIFEPSDSEGSPPMSRSQHRRGSKFTPSTFVERWIHRSSFGDMERPMLHRGDSRGAQNHSDEDMDDDFGVGIPIDSYPLRHSNNMSPDTLSLKSKPSTRRSSVDSSIDDVCMPLDDEDTPQGSSTGTWPDTAVLDEFANKEIEEQASAEAAELVRESVNEAADAVKGGRLRPRYAPWERNNVLKSQSNMRFAYFRDNLEATVHSPSIAGLLQPGQTFADLFPSPPPRNRPSSDAFVQGVAQGAAQGAVQGAVNATQAASASLVEQTTPAPSAGPSSQPQTPSNQPANTESAGDASAPNSQAAPSGAQGGPSYPGKPAPSRSATTSPVPSALCDQGPKDPFPDIQPSLHAHSLHGPSMDAPKVRLPSIGPVATDTGSSDSTQDNGPWWLDINSPTEDEMRILSRAFGIHPLTVEDIILHETREKVELFHNYYFVCFTSFDVKAWESGASNDEDSKAYTEDRKRRGSIGQRSSNSSRRNQRRSRVERLKPLAVFSIVFKTGIITVHYRPTPHTINVRRRIRLLRDYLNVSSDWISYALIDDITDGYGPLISAVDEDVQGIEDAILQMHGSHSDSEDESDDEKSVADSRTSGTSSTGYREWREKGNMLRWIGESRKRVMSLLSLLGNKADVIKGFAKRVSDHWSGAPRSEIAMYLSDIQDHLVTMTQSLNHYEKLLARSHSNYLAQINIDMTRTNNEMNDVLGKISVLGTIVLPMNIVTGLWGMNVLVPGQGDDDSLAWFWSITIMMLVFGISAYFLIMRFV